jgi:homeobox protein cut-like
MDVAVTAEGRSSHDEEQPEGGHGTNGTLNGGQTSAGSGLEAHWGEDNKFQRAIAVWRGVPRPQCYSALQAKLMSGSGIDLTNLVPKLDVTASDIVAHQRDSLVQRKDLAQKTKDFRKLDDAGKLSEYKGLLKGDPTLYYT